MDRRWILYAKERIPLLFFCFLTAGIALSGIYLQSNPFFWGSFVVSFIGIFLFFVLLRVMDDLKNSDKDRIVHPQRPIARGLLKKEEVNDVIKRGYVVLFAYCLIIWVFLQGTAALAYACIVLYLWLMFRGFYLGKWLGRRRLLVAIARHLVVIPIAIFAVAASNSSTVLLPSTIFFALMLWGAFFTYEACRDLDPRTHPIQATLIHFYGFKRTFEIVAIALVVSAMGAVALNLGSILLPCEGTVLITLGILFFQPDKFPIPRLAATLSLFVHVWAVVIHTFF
jgi:UbiA prenyltransferase family